MSPVWETVDLCVDVRSDDQWIPVVQDVNLRAYAGEILGVVGESGSGKTVTALASLGMVDAFGGRVASGQVLLDGRDILALPPDGLRQLRGRDVAMIFQEPRRSLDPAFSVGEQVAEVLRVHRRLNRRQAWVKAVDVLDRVEIPQAARRARDYPHMLSGGMCQRVMLAMALACEPKVLLADEPTTALDVTVQSRMLDLMRRLQEDMGLAIVLITHDLGVVSEMCDRVCVMYAGEVVEESSADGLFTAPQHPYTEGLLAALPQVDREGRLQAILGNVPIPGEWPGGCRFHDRCGHCAPACLETVPLDPVDSRDSANSPDSPEGMRRVRCVRHDEITLRGVTCG